MRKTSIKDIARRLHVSIALVSYVLNGKEKQARVGEEIAEKIRKTAAEMNYQPNMIARSLKSGKTHTIGLIVADISNPFFAAIARIIEDEAQQYNYTVLFGSSDENKNKSANLINILSNRQVDGFIIAAAENTEEQLQSLEKQNIPFVLIDRYFNGITANSIQTDNYQAAFEAITHLIETGYRKIAMASYDTGLQHMEDRRRGYSDALKKKRIKANPALSGRIRFDEIEEDMEQFIESVLTVKQKADAIFFATNTLALTGLKTLTHYNIKVPDELGIIAFDENIAFDFFHAPLTYISQPAEDMGREAVKLLIENIDHPQQKKKTVYIDAPLVVRKSTARR